MRQDRFHGEIGIIVFVLVLVIGLVFASLLKPGLHVDCSDLIMINIHLKPRSVTLRLQIYIKRIIQQSCEQILIF